MEEKEEISWQYNEDANAEDNNSQPRYLYLFCKRIFDFVSSLCVLIVLFIPLLIISIAVKLTSKGPIFLLG